MIRGNGVLFKLSYHIPSSFDFSPFSHRSLLFSIICFYLSNLSTAFSRVANMGVMNGPGYLVLWTPHLVSHLAKLLSQRAGSIFDRIFHTIYAQWDIKRLILGICLTAMRMRYQEPQCQKHYLYVKNRF